MTVQLERTLTDTAASITTVLLITIDGEERLAERRPDGSWQCPFCRTYTYGRDSDVCARRDCVADGDRTEAGLVRFREREAQAADAKVKAEAIRAKRAAIHDPLPKMAQQLGFAWGCTKQERAEIGHDEPPMCEASGTDKAEYEAHMLGHGAKACHSTKLIRLKRKAPKASLPKLPCPVLEAISWTEDHTTPAVCHCGHMAGEHNAWHGMNDVTWGCKECDCRTPSESMPRPVTQTAERSGQYWGNGPDAYSLWVVPFEAAPWEDGRPEPVLIYAGSPGKFFQYAYSAKYDR